VGKTELLEYRTERASDCRVIRVTVVQSEMELAFVARWVAMESVGTKAQCQREHYRADGSRGPRRVAIRPLPTSFYRTRRSGIPKYDDWATGHSRCPVDDVSRRRHAQR
jgi:hypothetical protein